MKPRLKDEIAVSDIEPSLTISPEKVCFIIKAKEFDAKDVVTEEDPGSNPSDDKDAEVLEDHKDAPSLRSLRRLSIPYLKMSKSISSPSHGWDAMIIPSATGPRCARRRRGPTMIVLHYIFLALRSSATFWKRASPCSAILVRSLKSDDYD
jgi:hypothetical protein